MPFKQIALTAALLCFSAVSASAQTYPAKPIRIIVGFAAGGPADVMARLVGQKLSTILGQSIVVDNRPGAGGTLGARAVAEAEPDVYRNVGYDPIKSFAPVAMLGATSNFLVVHPSFPPRSLKELIALAKAEPGKLNYSSPGAGTPPHLIGEMLKLKAGIDIVHVPYKGGGSAAQAVMAQDVHLTFENPAVSLPHIQAGKVRALAVTSEQRNRQAPDVPTMIESGLADFVSVSFTGVVAPAGTRAEVVERLNAAINESLRAGDIESAFVRLAVEPRLGSAEAFTAFLAAERERWSAVIKAVGVKME
jgi:tripartite-type tricarboxylate transporter receptor subunit TctC